MPISFSNSADGVDNFNNEGSDDNIEDDTTFSISKEGVPYDIKTDYKKKLNPIKDPNEEATGATGGVADMISRKQKNVSRCTSRFLSEPTFNKETATYVSACLESEAVVYIPDELKYKWEKISLIQVSKITFEQNYGLDGKYLYFTQNLLDGEEWVLDSVGNIDPAYSTESTVINDFKTNPVKIWLKDKPRSRMESKEVKTPLTRVVRKQEFLVFLVMVIDGTHRVLHSFKWVTEFEWLANAPGKDIHVWKILPNKEPLPKSDLTLGNCNDNQIWYFDPVENSIIESGMVPPYPKFLRGLSLKEFKDKVQQAYLSRSNFLTFGSK